ncbi:unnamed protein product [Protopolystoma xenopodis]|uniref:Uncharacterized protein n=1 Tax=Protopolystoma xenopodis TaxID=117903 RepID=A0A3S5A3E3_9PLAT|nr:unnamed protein product [Protopolystoma xenopodis]
MAKVQSFLVRRPQPLSLSNRAASLHCLVPLVGMPNSPGSLHSFAGTTIVSGPSRRSALLPTVAVPSGIPQSSSSISSEKRAVMAALISPLTVDNAASTASGQSVVPPTMTKLAQDHVPSSLSVTHGFGMETHASFVGSQGPSQLALRIMSEPGTASPQLQRHSCSGQPIILSEYGAAPEALSKQWCLG